MFRRLNVPLAATIFCLAGISVKPSLAEQPTSGAERLATDWGEIRIADRGLSLQIADGRLPAAGKGWWGR